MIHFFRKIRKQLAENNQFFKYSRYAIGEIVLVVVGILIALQINNWNERRIGIVAMQDYLSEVLQDLEKDKDYIESAIIHCDSVLAKGSNYREKFNDSIEWPVLVGLQIDAMSGNKFLIFPSRTIIEKISSIDYVDKDLRRALLALKTEQERLIKINEEHIRLQNQNLNMAQNLGWNSPLANLSLRNEEFNNWIGYDERWPDLIMIMDGLIDQKTDHAQQAKNDFIKLNQRLNVLKEKIEQDLTP